MTGLSKDKRGRLVLPHSQVDPTPQVSSRMFSFEPQPSPETTPIPEKSNGTISEIRSPFDPLKQRLVYVNSSIMEQGLSVSFRQGTFNETFTLTFPPEIWSAFPPNLKQVLRDNIAHLTSIDLGIMFNIKKIKYDTPLPQFKSFFIELILKCLVYSGDCASGQTVEYLSRLCNMEFAFTSQSPPLSGISFTPEERSINTLTFGKESLVSFGLCREIGLNPIPVTVVEPDLDVLYREEHLRSFENKHKEELIRQFEQEFNIPVHKVYNNLGDLRYYAHWGIDETELGWSSQLTEYLFYLLPFSHHYKGKYLVYGNENSVDHYYYSKEGFKCIPAYDQSSEWTSHMNAILHPLTNGTVKATSLVFPIQEIAVCKVLYQRYPELAKYQMSCHANGLPAENNRWCNNCSKCARLFVFMKALGFDPTTVRLGDMFSAEHKKYFSLFNQSRDMLGYDSKGLGRDEQLFAFYLAAKRGATGELIEKFKSEFWEEAVSREEEFRMEFFKIRKPVNIPPAIWKKIKPIFEEELKK